VSFRYILDKLSEEPYYKVLSPKVFVRRGDTGTFVSNGKGDLSGKMYWDFLTPKDMKGWNFEFEFDIARKKGGRPSFGSSKGPYSTTTRIVDRGAEIYLKSKLLDGSLPNFYIHNDSDDWA
jgi:hypothetical protein